MDKGISMTTPSGNLGNVISRLQGLKNVRPRKVMPGAEFIEKLAPDEPEFDGISQPLPEFSNFNPPAANLPELILEEN
jgi:hypothetical protein